jgi:hypothetical protein
MVQSGVKAYLDELKQRLLNMVNSEGQQVVPHGIPTGVEKWSADMIEQIQSGTTTIVLHCYGRDHLLTEDFLTKLRKARQSGWEYEQISSLCYSKLVSIENDIKHGMLGDLESRVAGEIFADFLVLARTSLEESKDVAAVLACAALEDALKRLGRAKGLVDLDDKDMSEVMSALKRAGVLKGAQSTLLSNCLTIRNRAFHANWDKIAGADVSAVIGFTEQILRENFSST